MLEVANLLLEIDWTSEGVEKSAAKRISRGLIKYPEYLVGLQLLSNLCLRKRLSVQLLPLIMILFRV